MCFWLVYRRLVASVSCRVVAHHPCHPLGRRLAPRFSPILTDSHRFSPILTDNLTNQCALVSCSLSQLRVVRAFKSTLEDIEEKRSVHSYHSLHSLRSSRSHHGYPRPLSEDYSGTPAAADGHRSMRKTEPNGSYTNMALVQENNAQSGEHRHRRKTSNNKSRSAENISSTMSESTRVPSVAVQRPSPKPPSPRTSSSSDINVKHHETAI